MLVQVNFRSWRQLYKITLERTVQKIWPLPGKHNSDNSKYGCSHRTQWNMVVQQTKSSKKILIKKCVFITKGFE